MKLLSKKLKAIIEDEDNLIANLSNASAILYNELEDINWAGFYIYDKENNNLVLGPFQGQVACVRIGINKGVCGTSYYKKETLLVSNVHEFEGHIACDSRSNSEIVIPFFLNNGVSGVLDIDSPSLNRFKNEDKVVLEEFINILIDKYSK